MCVHKFSVKVNLNICMRVRECTRMVTKKNKTLVEWLELKDVGGEKCEQRCLGYEKHYHWRDHLGQVQFTMLQYKATVTNSLDWTVQRGVMQRLRSIPTVQQKSLSWERQSALVQSKEGKGS